MSTSALSLSHRRLFEAAAECIMPEDDDPGARQAGVVDYLDWLLARDEQGKTARQLAEGLDFLDAICRQACSNGFLECGQEGREQALRQVQSLPHATHFIYLLLRITLTGFLCHPSYGGNRDFAGWR